MRSLLSREGRAGADARAGQRALPPAARRYRLEPAIRGALGAALLLLTVLPVYRLLDPERTGIAGAVTVAMLDVYHDFSWSGLLLILPVGIVAARLLSPDALERWLQRATAALLRPSTNAFVLVAAAAAALAGALFSIIVLDRSATFIDAFPQLLQARYWAAGQLAGPTSDLGGHWGIQNALFTSRGWVSQYPPGFVALLVPFVWLGAPWLAGPVLIAVTVFGAGMLAHRLFADDRVVARAATLLVATSPFFIFLGASLMNHVATAACVFLGGFLFVRAWQEQPRWSLAAGALFALSLATRPLSTLAFAAVFLAGVPLLWPARRARVVAVGRWGLLGALPVLAAWLAYNRHFFGSPFTAGYTVALGPAIGPGLHRDPWGNQYGAVEALAYTSSDLTALAVSLFETPLPAVLVIALFLLAARRLAAASWFVLALAVAPVLANALYWHHGLYMGPRMLHEAAPAWASLFAVALVGLVRRTPPELAVARRYFVRPGLVALATTAFAAAFLFLVPARALSHRVNTVPPPRPPAPALVFVHDAWSGRTAMTLAAAGLRLDRVETLLRQNATCRVHQLARAYVAGDREAAAALLAALDTLPRPAWLLPDEVVPQRAAGPGMPRQPLPVEISPGNRMRYFPGEVLTPECLREVLSDRNGTIDIAPLLPRAALHGVAAAGVLVVRDLGPERNAALRRAHPERTAWVYAMSHPRGVPELLSYERGMTRLWTATPDSLPRALVRHGLWP